MTPLLINSEDIHISINTVCTVCIRLYSIYTVYIRYYTVYGNVIYGSGQPYLFWIGSKFALGGNGNSCFRFTSSLNTSPSLPPAKNVHYIWLARTVYMHRI